MKSPFLIRVTALRDDDIKDDVICAKRIFRQHKHLHGNGFNAWYVPLEFITLAASIYIYFTFVSNGRKKSTPNVRSRQSGFVGL